MTMRRVLMAVILAGLTGCASSFMKSTPFYEGPQQEYNVPAEERVNLWPLSYYRDPSLSVLWPLCGFNLDDGSGWTLTAYWSKQGFTLLPLCHFDVDDASFVPLFYRDEQRFLSLPWYQESDGNGNLSAWAVPPALTWWTRDASGASEMMALGGLGGWRTDAQGKDSSWCLPLYFTRSNGDLYTPLFGWSAQADSSWVFPMWYEDAHTILSLPWYSHTEKDGSLDSWMIPPLLAYGQRSHDKGCFSTRLLLGLTGWDTKGDAYASSWVFPLYGHEKGRAFYSPLYAEKDDIWGIPPLLTWGERSLADNKHTVHTLLGLGGLSSTTNGYESSWLFPLYYHDRENLYSPLYGHTPRAHWLLPLWYRSPNTMWFAGGLFGMTPNTQWLTPCAIHTGNSWLFALGLGGWSGRHGVDHSWLLPLYWAGHGSGDFATIPFGSVGGLSWWLTPLFGSTETTWWATPFVGRYERGPKVNNWLFPLVGWGRDKETDWSQVLLGLLWNSETNRRTGSVDRSILWRLWHHVEADGDVSMDLFPFITYDAKKNGYEKTSFLWKLYNRETDAQGRTHLDLFFIPVK